MKRKLSFILFVILTGFFHHKVLAQTLQSPTWTWASAIGIESLNIDAAITDSSGNTYVMGTFYGASVNVSGTVITGADEAKTNNMFISKFNPAGKLEWVRSIYGKSEGSINIEPLKLEFLNQNNIVVLVNIYGANAVTDGRQEVSFNNTSSNTFLIRFYKDGRSEWISSPIVTGEGNNFIYSYDLEINDQGNIFFSGYFGASTITLGDISKKSDGADYYNFFLAKISYNGEPQWLKTSYTVEPSQYNGAQGISLSSGPDGSVVVVGDFNTYTINIDDKEFYNNYGPDVFIAKFSEDGNTEWLTGFGDSSTERPVSVGTGPNGEVTVSGYYNSYWLQFDNDTIYNSGQNNDYFVAHYASDGTHIWSKNISSQMSYVNANKDLTMNVGGDGNVYLIGTFESSQVFSGGNIVPNQNPGTKDIFLVKFDPEKANILWTRRISSADDDYPSDVIFDQDDNIVMIGSYNSDLDIEVDILPGNMNYGNIYTIRYNINSIPELVKVKKNEADKSIYCSVVSTDSYKNIYFSGTFTGGQIPLDNVSLNENGNVDQNGVFLGRMALLSGISGTVFLPDGTPATDGYVSLLGYIRRQKAPVMDTARIGSDGTYMFGKIGYGKYLLYAMPRRTQLPDGITTYYPGVSSWEQAEHISVFEPGITSGMDITFLTSEPLNGSVTIGGIIETEEEENNLKGTSAIMGKPEKDVSVILISREKSTGNIISQTFSDEFGEFIFTNVSPGCYDVIVDIAGIVQETFYEVCLNDGDDLREFLELNYIVNYEEVYPSKTKLNIGELNDISESKVNDVYFYPNPANTNIQIINHGAELKNIVILNTNGQVVLKNDNINHNFEVDISTLLPGIYFVEIVHNQGKVRRKLIKTE